MIEVRFRPIDRWPDDAGNPTTAFRSSPFRAAWSATLDLLDAELRQLDADSIVIQLALQEKEIRLDGWPRSEARPEHPGVVLAFESRYGALKYATAEFSYWQDNLRAIALGLESLRRVDRYGITKRGEQYTGWKALPSGHSDMKLAERGAELVDKHGSIKAALMATHPDHGGDSDDFRAVRALQEGS